MEVVVVVRPGADPARCLAALAADGVEDPRVVAVREPAGGLPEARNRALATCAADVLAFIDDDVAVRPGWSAALRSAFEEDAMLGAAFGPLHAAFPDGRPACLGDDLLVAFGVDPSDDDRPGRTGFAGNLAVRTAALRGVGGFWPMTGDPDVRDWFTEEHHAQRELARAGWTVRCLAGAAADRLVPAAPGRRPLLRARTRTGARAAVVGEPRNVATTLRALATGLAGAPLAAATRDRARTAGRLARAAESAGRLLGPRLAAQDLAPAARRTPLRASVPPGPSRARNAARPGATVLLYHRVVDHGPDEDPLGLAVTPEHLAAHLDVLAGRLTTLEAVAAGTAPDGSVALTFDDGYADNLHHAAPLLTAAEATATLFVCTGRVQDGRGFWWDDAARLLAACDGPVALRLGDDGVRAWPARSPTARAHLHAWLQPQPPEAIQEVLGQLAAQAGQPPPGQAADEDRPLTRDELGALAQTGAFTFGAHTRTHRSLAWADPQTQHDDLAGSADDLEGWLGARPVACSYPFGVPGDDVDATTRDVARRAGFTIGVVNTAGVVTPGTDRLLLPRRTAPDVDGPRFAAWLDAPARS